MATLGELITKASITKHENIALGLLSQGHLKPMKLKRELRTHAYSQIPPNEWAEMHDTVTKMIGQTLGVQSEKKTQGRRVHILSFLDVGQGTLSSCRCVNHTPTNRILLYVYIDI